MHKTRPPVGPHSLEQRLFNGLHDSAVSDEDIGKLLLALRLDAEREARGISQGLGELPVPTIEQWVLKIRVQEAGDVRNIALEKAFHKAANGEFASAGSIFRALVQDKVINAAALDEAVTGRRRQAAIARRPRPRRKPTHKSEVIAAMASAAAQGMTLDTFLESASVGSIAGLQIKRSPAKGVARWCIDCDAVESTKPPVARTTLEGWWTEANVFQP